MIECVNENIWYIKRRKKKSKKKKRKVRRNLIFLFVVVFIGLICTYYHMTITDYVADRCEEIISEYAVVCVNDAVMSTALLTKYDDIVTIEKDKDDKITCLTVNSLSSNTINRTVSKIAKENLENLLNDGVPIPFGAFSGIPILSGIGKDINLKIASVENIICDFNSEFVSVGINQSLHRLYLDVSVETIIQIPGENRNKVVKSQVLLCENLIVGEIPEIYLNN